jgi:hypothetical protein
LCVICTTPSPEASVGHLESLGAFETAQSLPERRAVGISHLQTP